MDSLMNGKTELEAKQFGSGTGLTKNSHAMRTANKAWSANGKKGPANAALSACGHPNF
jgi:hypothetical protein